MIIEFGEETKQLKDNKIIGDIICNNSRIDFKGKGNILFAVLLGFGGTWMRSCSVCGSVASAFAFFFFTGAGAVSAVFFFASTGFLLLSEGFLPFTVSFAIASPFYIYRYIVYHNTSYM